METVEVVIRLPQKVYEDCIMIPSDIKDWKDEISKAFKNGTVLPKGHGRLIDADKLSGHCGIHGMCQCTGDCDNCRDYVVAVACTKKALTIIEADKEDNNG